MSTVLKNRKIYRLKKKKNNNFLNRMKQFTKLELDSGTCVLQ